MISVLSTCGDLGNLLMVKWAHCLVVKLEIKVNVVLGTCLIVAYRKCGDLDTAVRAFNRMSARDSITWNALVAGMVENGGFLEALRLSEEMRRMGVNLEGPVFISAFKACAVLGDFEAAKRVHILLEKSRLGMSINMISSIVDMYMKFGEFETANQLFERMIHKDVVAWMSMITGYAQHGCSKEALIMFCRMLEGGVKPNEITLSSVLSACAQSKDLRTRTWIHHYIKKHQLEQSVMLSNAIVDMYAKCGRIEDVLQVFEEMLDKDLSSWNIIINGLARHGAITGALIHFESMVNEGIQPNPITLVGVLSACSHAGLIDCGHHHFDLMSRVYGIQPRLEHYSCMVDLFGQGL